MPKRLDRITVHPEICMGQPTIRGMRIPVASVLKRMASGMTHAEIIEACPELGEADFRQVMEYGPTR